MSPWWLLLIVPASVAAGWYIGFNIGVRYVENFLTGRLISSVPESQIKRF